MEIAFVIHNPCFSSDQLQISLFLFHVITGEATRYRIITMQEPNVCDGKMFIEYVEFIRSTNYYLFIIYAICLIINTPLTQICKACKTTGPADWLSPTSNKSAFLKIKNKITKVHLCFPILLCFLKMTCFYYCPVI